MLLFLNNGGLEMILAMGYFAYIMIMAKVEDRRIVKERHMEKWHW